MRCLDSVTDSKDMNLSKLWVTVRAGKPGVLQSMGLHRVRHDLALNSNIETLRIKL